MEINSIDSYSFEYSIIQTHECLFKVIIFFINSVVPPDCTGINDVCQLYSTGLICRHLLCKIDVLIQGVTIFTC